jgi:hypothetical protein
MFKVNAVPKEESDSLLNTVNTYRALKRQIQRLEEELKEKRDALEAAARQTPDGVLETPDFKITLTLAQRENFNLKTAKQVLGEEALKDFISVTNYTLVRVS